MSPRSEIHHQFRIFVLVLSALALRLDAQETDAPAVGPLPVRQQQIELRPGWNAVWLEVNPTNTRADQLFANSGIDICARYFRPVSSMEYIKSPAEAPFKGEGWGVWYAPGREEAEIRSLEHIHGPAAYLLHSKTGGTWTVSGSVRFPRYEWKHGNFTLAGFSVDGFAPPTFDAYFAGSEGRVGSRIFRLIEGRWHQIPGSTPIRSGEACWIFAAGDSRYQGPLTIGLDGSAVDFTATSAFAGISYRNTGAAPCQPSVEVVSAAQGGPGLPLLRVTPVPSGLTATTGPVSGALATLAPGEGETLRLAVPHGLMTQASQAALLRVADGAGGIWWVPVHAAR